MSVSIQIDLYEVPPGLDTRALVAYLKTVVEESTGLPVDMTVVEQDFRNLLKLQNEGPLANNG